MNGIFLLLGSNMGDRLENMRQATRILEGNEMVAIDHSSVYESAPWGEENQNWFLNAVLRVDTIHSPQKLLEICLKTEIQMGRERIKKWGSRLIDVDILYFDNLLIEESNLIVPHPGIPIRRFTLMPMCEIAPNERHPLLYKSQQELLDICPDELDCRKTKSELIP